MLRRVLAPKAAAHPHRRRKVYTRDDYGRVSDLSLLLLPWPLELRARDFKRVSVVTSRKPASEANQEVLPPAEDRAGFFSYQPDDDGYNHEFPHLLNAAIGRACSEVEKVDLVVLPEAALSESQVKQLEHVLIECGIKAYIAGVRPRTSMCASQFGNAVYFGHRKDTDQAFTREQQPKHHRWCMNDWQIRSYQLGGRLHPNIQWWEDIPIGKRRVNFVNFGDELTVCPLICEDLARQDPIADLIRAVGPSLAVAILMDGPQLKKRWAARYAAVLADDPGSSVVTLTSYAMVRRYAIHSDENKSSAIALWSDRTGQIREISLEPDSIGVILSLAVEERSESTIDERWEDVGTFTLTYGGVHQVKVDRKRVTDAAGIPFHGPMPGVSLSLGDGDSERPGTSTN